MGAPFFLPSVFQILAHDDGDPRAEWLRQTFTNLWARSSALDALVRSAYRCNGADAFTAFEPDADHAEDVVRLDFGRAEWLAAVSAAAVPHSSPPPAI